MTDNLMRERKKKQVHRLKTTTTTSLCISNRTNVIEFHQISLVQLFCIMMCYKSELKYQYRQHYRLTEKWSNCMNNY